LKIVVGDKAGFALNGSAHTHNVAHYAPKGQPPDFKYVTPESREKVTIWAGLCDNGSIIGPCFFDENVNGVRYVDMINDEIVPDMNTIFNFNLFADVHFEQNVWWFQDGAPCHRPAIVRNRLRDLFGQQVVAIGHDREWPPRSPDLTACDFFLWGYIKSKVYRGQPPQSIIELRERIMHEFELLRNDPDKIQRSVISMESKARTCLERGGHIETSHA